MSNTSIGSECCQYHRQGYRSKGGNSFEIGWNMITTTFANVVTFTDAAHGRHHSHTDIGQWICFIDVGR